MLSATAGSRRLTAWRKVARIGRTHAVVDVPLVCE